MKDTTLLLLNSLNKCIDSMECIAKEFKFEIFLDSNNKIILKSKNDIYVINIVCDEKIFFWNIYCKKPFACKYNSITLISLFKLIIFKDNNN